MEAINNLKKSVRRLFVRVGMLGAVVLVGALAVAQLQHDRLSKIGPQKSGSGAAAEISPIDDVDPDAPDQPPMADVVPAASRWPASAAQNQLDENFSPAGYDELVTGDQELEPQGYDPADYDFSNDSEGLDNAQDLNEERWPQGPPPRGDTTTGTIAWVGDAPPRVTPTQHTRALDSAESGSLPPSGRDAEPVFDDPPTTVTPGAGQLPSTRANPYRATTPAGGGNSLELPPLLDEGAGPEFDEPPGLSAGGPNSPSAGLDEPDFGTPPSGRTPARTSTGTNSFQLPPNEPLSPPPGNAGRGAANLEPGFANEGPAASTARLEDPQLTGPPRLPNNQSTLPAGTGRHAASGSSSSPSFDDQDALSPPPAAGDNRDSGNGFGGYRDQYATPEFQQDVSSQAPASGPRQFDDSIGIPSGDPPRDAPSSGLQGSGRPGPSELEGPQNASVVIQKIAPNEMRFGQTSVVEIRVRNLGPVAADQVVVQDELPEGVRLIETTPQAESTQDGLLVWQLGTLRPGEEKIVKQQLQPIKEGALGSVATVSFQTSASARSKATRPLLKLKHTGPQSVLVGQPVKFLIELSNPGTGTATNVTLEENVPDGLSHSSGSEIEYKVGNIAPGTTRRLELTLRAAKAGQVENLLVARADGQLAAEDNTTMEVVAPQLQLKLNGPERRYLERQATFELVVANPGTADATNVDLTCRLPQGMQFVRTNNSGLYEPTTRMIQWSLARLPAGKMGKVEFTVMPTMIGEQILESDVKADMDLKDRTEQLVTVEGLAALFFGVADLTDPIEVGGRTRYEIRVVNQGTKPASNVQVIAEAPAGMRPLEGDGQTRGMVRGQQFVFEPLAQLAPKSEVKYYVVVEGAQAGQHLFRVKITSDDLREEVVKEESTIVYSDE